jgi:hypothetical protein
MPNIAGYVDQQFLNAAAGLEEVGIGGFTAFVRIRDSFKLSAEVPNTPVETGANIADHIIRQPLTLTIEGDVSNVYLRGDPIIAGIQRAQAEIGNLSSQFAPARTQAQLAKLNALANTALDAIARLQSIASAGAQVVGLFGNNDAQKPPQELFIDAMEALHYGGQVIDIDMPYRTRRNMVITSFEANTDNEADSTGFTIEAQQITFAELEFVEVATPSPGLGGQTDSTTEQGTQAGEPVERSLLSNIFG